MRVAGVSTLSLVFVLIATQTATADCEAVFGSDRTAVEAVQRSWGPAELAMRAGEYDRARAMLEKSAAFLPSITDAFTRACVAGGADIRINEAIVGQNFLRVHPKDIAGARAAADQAWKSFPTAHNCP